MLKEADLAESVRRLFQPALRRSARDSRLIGAELEMIPVGTSTGKRVLAQTGKPSGSEFVRSMATEFGWIEEPMVPDPSCWNFPDGRVTFEPGGQIEFSSAVFPTATDLLRAVEKWTEIFGTRAGQVGIDLKTIGIDDRTSVTDVPLQLARERYTAMTQYFNSLGPFGVMMMRQTASLQINVERGPDPVERWRLLNMLAPYLVAIFANSPSYEETDTGHKSYRAHVWRKLDPARTGIAPDSNDPAMTYLQFALDAPVILHSRDAYPTFRELLNDSVLSIDDWDLHLSTLFPEVRPREYFEIRSIDAIDAAHIPAAIALVAGLVYADDSTNGVRNLVDNPDQSLLVRAGEAGLDDREIRQTAERLVRLALSGCAALGRDYMSAQDIESAEQFFARYTLRGRSPGSDRQLISG